jgi:hypothetical protein
MKQSTFEKEIFIHSDAQTVINVIADYSQYYKIHTKRNAQTYQDVCRKPEIER